MAEGEQAAAGGSQNWLRRNYLPLLTAILLLAVAAIYFYSSFGIRVPPLGDMLGPRSFPIVVGAVFLACSAGFLLRLITGREAEDDHSLSARGTVLLTLSLIVAYVLLLSFTGYLVATAAFVFTVLTLLRFRGPFINLVAGLVAAGLFSLVFGMWLGVESIGRASCRVRVCRSVSISVVAVPLQKQRHY